MRNVRLAILSIILLLCAAYVFFAYFVKPRHGGQAAKVGIVERTYRNYGAQTLEASKKFDIPQEYLLALIALECSGRKIIPHRFEAHVYRKLKQVKTGELRSMEKVTHNGIKAMSDDAIKNLSRSWGPYQIMGYKVFEMGVKIEDLRGARSVVVGASWIRKNYGEVLDNKHYKDAFHIHNTGSPYPSTGPPKTYNKNYIPKGMEYIQKFKDKINS